ncbi:predicted protein [Histoplasma capsulatum H143]|uniref:Uncharacterized protein n=1 Tax=Ajellomyces capsulatus (strain H143) TaxID=544712 RepID=C6H480_AJECH|nr:predicted protein [Histoplasma capsulatum H143]
MLASLESCITNFGPCPLQFPRPAIRGETDSSPRHKLQEDEPLRKAMLSFLRTQLGQSGGEIGVLLGVSSINPALGYVLAITITTIALGQSANRAIIILHDTLSYGFLFIQTRCEDSDELCSPLLPTKTTRMTDDGNPSRDFGTFHQPSNPP